MPQDAELPRPRANYRLTKRAGIPTLGWDDKMENKKGAAKEHRGKTTDTE